MAVIKAVSSKAGIGQALDYVTKEEKTEDKLVSGLHCEPDTVKDEMQATKELWGKTGGRTYKHFVQSYHEDEHITPEQAHRNAVELAKNTEAWKGHEVLIATHIDRGHIHSHFIVNSVNYENGHKLQWSKADLQNLKDRCNEQSRQQGLHVPEKGKTFSGEEREETVAWNKETYNLLKQAEEGEVKSYVQDTALAVMDCRETATSREDFIDQMKARGYGVDWKDSHKYITFTDLERQSQGEKQCKVRNNKLEKYYAVDFGKESLEHGFEINARREAERTATTERARQQLDRTAVSENSGADERARARQLLDRTAVAEDSRTGKAYQPDNTAVTEERLVFVGGIAIGVGFLIFLGASKVFEFYTEDYADTMSLAVFLISLAVSVYFAEPIRAVIPINLLLLLILVHIVYVLIRWYVKGCMRSRGYY